MSAPESLACEVRLRQEPDRNATPFGARATSIIAAPPERVWHLLTQFERYPERVPMIHSATVEAEHVTIALRFRVALFSTTFQFTARIERAEGRRLALLWTQGEPRDLCIAFELAPAPEGTLLTCDLSYDLRSLGWVVKYFLKHHPEIALGSYAGTALTLVDALRRAAEKLPAPDPTA